MPLFKIKMSIKMKSIILISLILKLKLTSLHIKKGYKYFSRLLKNRP